MRLVDRGGGEQGVVPAVIGDRERALRDLVRLERFRPRAMREVVHGALQPDDALLVSGSNHGHDQPPVQGHRDADVDVLVQDQVLAVERCVDDRKRFQRRGRGLQEERHESQLGAVLLQELVLRRASQLGDPGAVHGMDGRHMRRDALRPHHVLGDALPHGTQRLRLEFPETGFRSRREGRGRDGRRSRALLAFQVGEDVFLGDPAAGTGARADQRQIDPLLMGYATHERGAANALAGLGLDRRRGRRLGRGGNRGRWHGHWRRCRRRRGRRGGGGSGRGVLPDLGAVTDERNYCVDLDGLALRVEDRLQDPGIRRGHFGIDLVGRNLEESLVALNLVARRLQPLGNGALDDALAHLGHHDFSHVDLSSLSNSAAGATARALPPSCPDRTRRRNADSRPRPPPLVRASGPGSAAVK